MACASASLLILHSDIKPLLTQECKVNELISPDTPPPSPALNCKLFYWLFYLYVAVFSMVHGPSKTISDLIEFGVEPTRASRR